MLAIYLIRPLFFFGGGGIILLELRFISVEEGEIMVSAKKKWKTGFWFITLPPKKEEGVSAVRLRLLKG
jgi:hypothetical protein